MIEIWKKGEKKVEKREKRRQGEEGTIYSGR
jgi:hypothetical protein